VIKMVNKAIGIILLGIMLTVIFAGANSGCGKENGVMNSENNISITTPTIPPIDTAAPVKTETATFALG
jgi:hypothetical protein